MSIVIAVSSFILAQAQARDSASPKLHAPKVVEFLDSFWAKGAAGCPGLVVAVVQDGRLLAARGYGMADPVRGILVDPVKTVFRIASVSKPVVATAVLKLVDAGKLNVDADVNTYLKRVRIPPVFGKPITLTHLLTHTPGFEDRAIGTASAAPAAVNSLEEYLLRDLPRRVLPPGVAISYSNQGYAVAGLVVQDVSGVPFEDYADKEIFGPLGMKRTSFRMREDLMRDLALGHEISGQSFVAQPIDYLHCSTPGGVLTTAIDFVPFMTLHLTGKTPDGNRLLSEKSLQRMHEAQFRHHPQMLGWNLGFSERRQGQLQGYGHSGDLRGFAADLSFWPVANLAVFVAYNTQGSAVRERLVRELLEAFVPEARSKPTLASTSAGAVTPASGAFLNLRRNRTGIEKLGVLAGNVRLLTMVRQPNGELRMGGQNWRPITGGLYENPDGRRAMFRPADMEVAEMLLIETSAYDRLPWYEELGNQLIIAIFAYASATASMLVGLMGRIRRRFGRQPGPLQRFWKLSAITGALELAASIGLGVTMTAIPPFEFTRGMPTVVLAVIVFLHVAVLLAALTIAACLWSWLRLRGGVLLRLTATLFAAGHAAFLWLCWDWNVFGFQW